MTTQLNNLTNPLPETVYTPESDLRHPLWLIKKMWRDLLDSRQLAWRLMVRDISANYRQSFLGIMWAFLPPIVLAVGFTLAGNAKVINIATTELPYPAYVMFSMILWQTFVEALNGPVTAVSNAKQMLSRVNFPREAIVLAKLGEVFFNFGIKLVMIVAVFLYYKMPVTWAALLSPLALIQLIMLGTFIGLLLAPLGALYQDVAHGITVATGLWLFLTPVVYPIPQAGTFATIVKLNPVTPLLVTTRELATSGVVSQLTPFLIVSGITLVGLLLTWISFRLALPFAIERGSS
ncbi:MAG TPA: ABC transporter permease [Pyrinomonadaceae bacterium]|jgi:lipopolysaccharide transport system permease protein|nr:ABC transporter permease [Pyrinomonadaceae bacterium]